MKNIHILFEFLLFPLFFLLRRWKYPYSISLQPLTRGRFESLSTNRLQSKVRSFVLFGVLALSLPLTLSADTLTNPNSCGSEHIIATLDGVSEDLAPTTNEYKSDTAVNAKTIYLKFTPAASGEVTLAENISYDDPNEEYQMKVKFFVGTACGQNDLVNSGTKADSHGPFTFSVVGGNTYYVKIIKDKKKFMRYVLNFSFDKSSTSTGGTSSCDGGEVLNIHGATASATQSYVIKDIRGLNVSRYFKFKTQVDGSITIEQNSNKRRNGYKKHEMDIGTSCPGANIHNGPARVTDTETFTVTSGTWYYVKVKEKDTRNQINLDLDFDFTSSAPPAPTCLGCDCSLDTVDNHTSPGVTIPALNGATTAVSKCISGIIDNNQEYYKFTVQTDGLLSMNGSSFDGKKYWLKLGSTEGGQEHYGSSVLGATTHTASDISLSAGDTVYVYINNGFGGVNNTQYQLDFSFTPANTCSGCDCSLDTSTNDTSPGVTIPTLDGAASNVTKCISGSSEDDDSDYYNFTVATAGSLNITTSSPNGHDNHMQIISDQQGTLLTYDTDQVRDVTYDLTAGEKITIQFKETGEDLDEYEAKFAFTKSTSCGGCDCSLDTPANNSSPGTTIPDLDGATASVSKCISGVSVNGSADSSDYYHFTVNTEGELDITTSSPNGHAYHLKVGSSAGGGEYYTESSATDVHSVSKITLSAGDSVYIYIKETGSDIDQYQLNFQFTSTEYVENADDLCYEDIESSGMMCMDMGICKGGMGCKNTIPIKNDSNETLSAVKVVYDESGMGGSFGSDCGVDPSGTCGSASTIDMGPVGILGSVTNFSVTPSIPPETTSNNSVWASNFMSGSCFGQNAIYAEYTKNGKKYRGIMKPCGASGGEPADETIPTDEANVTSPTCGIFADMFQTRETCGGSGGTIEFTNGGQTLDGTSDIIVDANGSELNTCTLTVPNWVENQFETCGAAGDCTASGSPALPIAVEYDNPPAAVSLVAQPADTSATDVTLNGTTTLTESEYDAISTSWHTGTNTTFTIDGELKVNSLKLTSSNVVSFGGASLYNIEIGTIGIASNGAGNSLNTNNDAKNIKIKTLNLAANTTIDFSAKQTIKIEDFTVGRGGSSVTLKAPYVNLNSMTFSNSGSGTADIHIIADYIDIGSLDFGQGSTLTVEPYTAGKRVLWRSDSITATSSSTMVIPSGNYYTDVLDIPGTSDAASIIASDTNQLINLYINGDFKPGNNPGVNAPGNGGNFGDNPPANFLIYINGDFGAGNTAGGGTTYNATIYVEGKVDLGNPTYIQGAVSAQSIINVGQGQFYYDQNISAGGWGQCETTIPPEPAFEESCGIFPSVLTSYEHLTLQKNPIIQSCYISYPEGNFTDGATIKPTCYVDSNMTEECVDGDTDTDNGNCTYAPPPDNRFDHDFIATADTTSTTNSDSSVTLNEYEYGNISFTKNNQNITFDPQTTYSGGSSRKVMVLGDITFTKNNSTLIFKEGDYYFRNLDFQKNGVRIQTQGDVKFFISNDFDYAGNGVETMDDNTSSLFVYTGGNAAISSTGGGNGWLGMFMYVKGDVTVASNSNTKFYGGITSEGSINVTGNNFQFEYNEDGAANLGFPDCSCGIVQFQDDQYDISEDFENPMPAKKSVHPVIELPNGPAQRDFNISYTTLDGSAIRGADYVSKTETVTIHKGDSNLTLDIEIYNDPAIELDEYFFVQLYDPQPEGRACLNDHNKTKIMILAQTNSPICFDDSFDAGLDDKWRVLKSSGSFTPGIVDVNGDKRLRMTPDQGDISTAVTKDYEFDTTQNLIIVEFDYYAYGGCNGSGAGADGADGIVNVLFDSTVGDRPTPGGYGGSMGYAQMNNNEGFEMGWLGLGIDEYGNFANCNENREGGLPSTSCDGVKPTGFPAQSHRNTVSLRGDGSGLDGYEFLQGVELSTISQPEVAKKTGFDADGYYSGRYKMTVDARDKAHLYIRLERDTGSGYTTIINQFDAKKAEYGQGETPDFIRYAITAGTGDGCNNHEISWIQMRGNCQVYVVQGVFTTGPFDVRDVFRWEGHRPKDGDVDDHAISTKIVGQPFSLQISSMNEDQTASETKSGINVKYGIYEGTLSIPIIVETLRDAEFTSQDTFTDEFTIMKAGKFHSRVLYCGDYNVTTGLTKLYPLETTGCWDATKSDQENIGGMVAERSTSGLHLFFHTSDDFMVRPKDWEIGLAGAGPFKAGEDVNISIKAANEQGDGSVNFSETAGETFGMLIEENTAGCKVGGFADVNLSSGWSFDKERGIAVTEDNTTVPVTIYEYLSTRYDNIGSLNITITDEEDDRPCEKTYAAIDCNDKNISGYWNTDHKKATSSEMVPNIGSASLNNIEWIPDHFEITATLQNHNTTGDFTYLSDDLDMAALLDLEISAATDENATTSNYNAGCYAHPMDLNISVAYTPDPINYPNTLRALRYKIESDVWSGYDGNSTDIHSLEMPNIATTNIFPAGDHNGTARLKVKLNLDREFNEAINPFDMNISGIRATDNDDASHIITSDFNSSTITTNATYLYARAKSSQLLYDNIAEISVGTPLSVVLYCDRGLVECDIFHGISVSTGQTNEYDWYTSEQHTNSLDGNVSLVATPAVANKATVSPADTTPVTFVGGQNNENVASTFVAVTRTNDAPLPLDVNITFGTPTTSSWLIYNQDSNTVPNPFYRVRFIGDTGWAGFGDTGHVVDGNVTNKRNRKMSW